MELFVSFFPVVLGVMFCFWLLALFLNLWHDDWLPLFAALSLATLWICQLLSDPLSEGAFLLLLTGVGGCLVAAIFCLNRLIRVILEKFAP
ncbi:MAG: hypothetical protein K2Y39_22755 [Candidatus Obscuribacterales bacterium]|nr:hypothetical protein [Candidatus Obscuribacterales bacterium]